MLQPLWGFQSSWSTSWCWDLSPGDHWESFEHRERLRPHQRRWKQFLVQWVQCWQSSHSLKQPMRKVRKRVKETITLRISLSSRMYVGFPVIWSLRVGSVAVLACAVLLLGAKDDSLKVKTGWWTLGQERTFWLVCEFWMSSCGVIGSVTIWRVKNYVIEVNYLLKSRKGLFLLTFGVVWGKACANLK